jgi:hypothetical protein
MRKIWIILPLGLAISIAMIGYFGYRAIKETLTLPEELAPYESRAAALKLIRSAAPAPGPEARLTARQVELFIGMLDSINIGSDNLEPALDALHLDTNGRGKSKPNILAVPGVVHQALMMAPLTRRAIVNYLNNNGLSWEEYLWIKERVLAASGITRAEADSSGEINAPASSRALKHAVHELADTLKAEKLRQMAKARKNIDTAWEGNGFDEADTSFDDAELGFDNTYEYLDELRTSVTVDASETALVARHRDLLLRRALKCMQGRDEEF